MPSLKEICEGEAGILINLLCFIPVLTWNGLRIYIFACFEVLLNRAYRFLCGPCISCCSTWEYIDTEFEGDTALGDGKAADWVRARELFGKDKDGNPVKPELYKGKIEPGDLCQGSVGDCWLVAALACAAEYPGAIRKAFVTPEYNPRGKYEVKLYDAEIKQWVTVTIDDRIPCEKGTTNPIYMKCHGNELWAVLLEKAFAKFCGSYKHLDGGWAMWGWRVLTGDHCFRLRLTGDVWSRTNFDAKRGKDGIDGTFGGTQEKYTSDQVWNLVLNYIEADCLVAASGGKDMGTGSGKYNAGGLNGEQLNDAEGLVGTHAYSILDARELGLIPGLALGNGVLGQTRLIKLRNPWGRYEWKGEWSDGSKEWDENPLIKMRLQPKDENDGCFWMPWNKFYEAGFKQIDICDRTTKDDLRLDIEEDMGTCGICVGSALGLSAFCCLCQGVRYVYFGQKSSSKTKSAQHGCSQCCAGDATEVHVPAQHVSISTSTNAEDQA